MPGQPGVLPPQVCARGSARSSVYRFDDEVLEWVRDALHASHADERCENQEGIKRHQAEHKRLQDRINALYVDKLDGLVDTAFYDRMSNQWREEQNRCQREIERHQNADQSYKDEGVALLDLARDVKRLFAKQQPREKRRLLNFVLSNFTWANSEVVATFRHPLICLQKPLPPLPASRRARRPKRPKLRFGWGTRIRT